MADQQQETEKLKQEAPIGRSSKANAERMENVLWDLEDARTSEQVGEKLNAKKSVGTFTQVGYGK